MTETFKDRLIKEYSDLSEKCDKLRQFIISDKFIELNNKQSGLLLEQHKYMLAYLNILDLRIKDLNIC